MNRIHFLIPQYFIKAVILPLNAVRPGEFLHPPGIRVKNPNVPYGGMILINRDKRPSKAQTHKHYI